MRFVFENIETKENFITCLDTNSSGIKRFPTSPIVSNLSWIHKTKFQRSFPIKKYIIASGVAHHPYNWAGGPLSGNSSVKTIFSYLNDVYLRDLKQGRAMLLFDQSHEGYQTSWLWHYFHTECQAHKINPQAIIYVTGNLLARDQYLQWADENNVLEQLNVIPYAHFERDIYVLAEGNNLKVNFNEDLNYKKHNLSNIKIFNCLNKRPRAHRFWFYAYLVKHGLNNDGLISMNKFNPADTFFERTPMDQDLIQQANDTLPSLIYDVNNNDKPDKYYINRIRTDICLDSWVSIISEALFGDSESTVFISEKTFKPIVAMHPFIVLGNRGSLVKLRELGYKTFDGFIDETYDTLPTFERFEAIIESIKKIQAIEDKLSWYESMQDILQHNHNQLVINSKKKNPAVIELERCYGKYFE
jgi:hypothetical protein